jgi:hypothetical protein
VPYYRPDQLLVASIVSKPDGKTNKGGELCVRMSGSGLCIDQKYWGGAPQFFHKKSSEATSHSSVNQNTYTLDPSYQQRQKNNANSAFQGLVPRFVVVAPQRELRVMV